MQTIRVVIADPPAAVQIFTVLRASADGQYDANREEGQGGGSNEEKGRPE
ncbi:MAG TPA: hypothetical protein VES62_07330 [Thermoleophilaceae bacterium]|nr:hypothetical protein [Thermoleophilaceae bacterium]